MISLKWFLTTGILIKCNLKLYIQVAKLKHNKINYAKVLTIGGWRSNITHNFLPKFELGVRYSIVVVTILSSLCLSLYIFVEMKTGQNMSNKERGK